MKSKPRFFATALTAIALSLPLRSAEPAPAAPYTGAIWALTEVQPVLAAAAEITTAKLPNCDYAVVDSHQVRTYRADGTAESQDEDFVKVLTERGRRMKRVLTRNFMIPYSRAEVIRLERIRPDGTVVPIDVAANSREASDSSQMSANIYDPNFRVLQVNIPGLELGDVIHAVTRETITRAIIPGEYAEENVFEEEGYIRHITYEVIAPAGHPLRHLVIRDAVPGTITPSQSTGPDGTITYRWEVNAVPRMYEEPAMPAPVMTLQRLFVSTLSDWPAVSKWYWNLSAAHLEATSPEIRQTVDQLTAGLTGPTEKLKAIFYYVSKNIRYMGITPEKDRPGFEPHDVALTFAKKYGVCRDKAALLVAMLRTAGFPAYPVLESYGWRKDAVVPDAAFNHAIVAVEQGKGDYLLMDPTDENTLDFLPAEECNWSYLVCRPDGEQIKVIPVNSPEKNLMTIRTTGELDAAGTLRATAELSFSGINDNAYRAAFARMKPDDRQRAFEAMLKQAIPGARLTAYTLTPANLLDRQHTLHAQLVFVANGLTAAGAGKSIVTLPWLGRRFGIVSFLLRSAGLEKRKYPLQTYVACGVREELAIKLSPEYTSAVSMPACTPDADTAKAYAENVALDHGVLVGSRNLELKVAEFDPTQYLALKRTLETMAYDERKAPILDLAAPAAGGAGPKSAGAVTPVESDTKLVEADDHITITDAHDAVVTLHSIRQILTYNGKKGAAEFKLPYNPACQQARLVRARVTSPDGKVQEISPSEINVMDADWNASAKRYTGGKLLVANLPGVDIGSTLEVEAELTIKGKPFLSGYIPFQQGDESVERTLTLSSPPGLPVETSERNPAGYLTKAGAVENGRKVVRWSARHIPGLPGEPNTPPPWAFLTGVHYFAGEPSAYWRDVSAAMMLHASHAAKAEEVARDLVRQSGGGLAAVTALRDYVVKSIRLAGPSFTELPLTELSDADVTLADGYGHAADRAILLSAMLEAVGFKPEFVLASGIPPVAGLREIATSVALPHVYDQPLVRVLVDGQAIYLNDTDQYAKIGSTTHDGFLALDLPDARIETVHAAPGCELQTNTVYAIDFADNGTAKITIDRQYFGPAYNERKRFFSELPPEERRRYFEQAVSSVAQGARPVTPLTTTFDTYPGTETFTVEIDHYGVVDGKHFYFSVPFRPSFRPVESDRRTLPLLIRRSEARTITADIKLPPAYGRYVISPVTSRWQAPGTAGDAEIVATNQPGHSVVNYRFRVNPAIVSPTDYPQMVAIESAVENRSTQLFLVDQQQPPAAPPKTE
ncbi:MAG TPA: DUF3857 domain-containing protein [Opitutaceae bacterium]|nr:DUF3857 domain-containing protein [Opitutaceae bacterium]